MTLLSYQIFKTVVDHGSFLKASEFLNLTPSAVSHAVSSMEEELGFSLFTRSKRGVSLTNYAKNLLPYINAVLNSDESLRQMISQYNGLQKGNVKLGCFSSVCTSWVPDIVESFKKEYSDIDIEIYQGTYDDVVCWIKNGVVDLGFLSVSSAGNLPITPLYKDDLLCVVPKGFKKAGNTEYVTIDEIRDQVFVSQRESTDADIHNFFRKYELNIKSSCHVVDDLSTIAMVASGFGICIMPELVMGDIPYQVDIYRIKPSEHRIIGLSALNSQFMAPAAKMLYQHIVEMYKTTEVE
ncbi:LysR family transcriptional regulator [Parasporobacterium paucivorans]|uniref:DNA-binding transcriptional regulator, LysR family n=1 Tax=Parasporobacterium paucivorans DSM 15970 TaxID=1122934 RepID=A0A1M6D768_9FIRM|nr:LysR family transcriptional regulator [Parasporobacterium paucivorans]SHI68838.1 DNA-binding transcriptional regulator, LysR family [Parasporobacterium paucivorans DSM 15970]